MPFLYNSWLLDLTFIYPSFPVIHKFDDVGFFVFLKFENKLNGEINHFNFNSKHHDKYKLALMNQ